MPKKPGATCAAEGTGVTKAGVILLEGGLGEESEGGGRDAVKVYYKSARVFTAL